MSWVFDTFEASRDATSYQKGDWNDNPRVNPITVETEDGNSEESDAL